MDQEEQVIYGFGRVRMMIMCFAPVHRPRSHGPVQTVSKPAANRGSQK